MSNPEILIVSVLVTVGVFLLFREVICWYFKINQRVSLLTDIKRELIKGNVQDVINQVYSDKVADNEGQLSPTRY
tara:strand:- start:1003 stop:1227 length:225 start_codon:yes stop_codon:yes gene_type:complete